MKFKPTLIALTAILLFSMAVVKAQTAPATSFTQSHLKAAERVLESSGLESNLQKTFTSVIDVKAQTLPTEKRAGFSRAMHKFINKYITFEEMKKAFVPIYASEFTETELNQIADFLSSPAGRKMTEKQSVLFKNGADWGQKIVMDHQADLEKMMKDEMGEK
jgi:hypothetical protein